MSDRSTVLSSLTVNGGREREDDSVSNDLPSSASRRPFGLDPRELLLLLAVGLFPLGYAPFLLARNWSLRFVVVVALLPVGLVALAKLAARRDRAAYVAVALLASAVVSALIAPEPLLSLLGYWGANSSVLLYAGALGAWAIGRLIEPRVVRLVPVVVALALVPSVIMGLLQLVLNIETGLLATGGGRASGFVANAAYFGTLVAGATVYSVTRSAETQSRLWNALAGVFGLGVGLSGGRAAIAATLLGLAGAGIWSRRRAVVTPTLWALAGILAGGALLSRFAPNSTIDRLAATSDAGRAQVWKYGLEAVTERPIFGWGLGNFAAAVQGRFSSDFMRESIQSEVTQSWTESHNILVQVAVSTGMLGLFLVLAFALMSSRLAADVPILLMAGVIATSWSLQPASIHSLTVVLVLLGASARRLDHVATRPRSRVMFDSWLLAGLVGLVCGAYVFSIDFRLNQVLRGDPGNVESIARWFPPDPVISDVVAEMYTVAALNDSAYVTKALEWSERTTELQPRRPYWWNRLARRQIAFGNVADSRASIDKTLSLQRWNKSGLHLLYAHALLTEDVKLEETALDDLCLVDPIACQLLGPPP